MRTKWLAFAILVVSALARANLALAQVTLETRDLRLTIENNGVVRSLLAKASNNEYCWTAEPGSAFSVKCEGRTFPASAVALNDDSLVIEFGEAGVTAKCKLVLTDDYIALKLVSVEGEAAVDRIDLLQLRVKPLPYLGSWIDVAYDDAFGVCLCGGNIKTNAAMSKPRGKRRYVTMTASAYRDPGIQGATAVLFGCPDPKEKFLDAMAIVERDFNMPEGAKNRRSPIQQYSYLWVSPTPDNINEYIRWAKRGGFRMILLSYTSFTKGVGHFIWNERYPNGMADLKKVTNAIRKAGLAVGLHIHYNKARKNDPYVTPVPDDRLHKVRVFTLAADVDEDDDTVAVNENPKGCTRDDGRRILKLGKELIAYKDYSEQPPYRFIGCERGHIKTTPAAHKAGGEAALLDVDTWNIFIRFDQNTDIQDETAERIAAIFREAGPFDMVYFDGAEDVHSPFWYHCANAQYRVFGRFQPPPPVCEAAANTHFSWHTMTRSNAYDSVAPLEMKAFCRRAPCRAAPDRALNFSRLEFGWLHGFGRSGANYIGPDVLEYVLSRGAAWDCPFSMTVNTQQLALNPRTEDCFDVIKTWEDARIEKKLTDAQREALKDLGQEHHLFINEKGDYELVAINEMPSAAGGRQFRAYSFRRQSRPDDTYILIWSLGDEADITFAVPDNKLTVMRPFGRRLPVEARGGKATIPVGDRLYLVFAGVDVESVEKTLREAKSSLEPTSIYVRAKDYIGKSGEIALSSSVGTTDEGAIGDCIVPTGRATLNAQKNWYVDYKFDCPYKGRWTLWGRMKYKDTGSNSFFAGIAGDPETKQRFGNKFVWGKWLWDGGPMFRLKKGPTIIRVYVRESAPRISPLLDVLCLTNDLVYKPTDELAAQQLKK